MSGSWASNILQYWIDTQKWSILWKCLFWRLLCPSQLDLIMIFPGMFDPPKIQIWYNCAFEHLILNIFMDTKNILIEYFILSCYFHQWRWCDFAWFSHKATVKLFEKLITIKVVLFWSNTKNDAGFQTIHLINEKLMMVQHTIKHVCWDFGMSNNQDANLNA